MSCVWNVRMTIRREESDPGVDIRYQNEILSWNQENVHLITGRLWLSQAWEPLDVEGLGLTVLTDPQLTLGQVWVVNGQRWNCHKNVQLLIDCNCYNPGHTEVTH